ncbi:hypothetical protein [Pseudomaricurvus sp.]|uniref:hypothetical protein n=1 Tax=Pseudomaricurvus sp. TaxID=2004510 RepID=UPI003F6D762B
MSEFLLVVFEVLLLALGGTKKPLFIGLKGAVKPLNLCIKDKTDTGNNKSDKNTVKSRFFKEEAEVVTEKALRGLFVRLGRG